MIKLKNLLPECEDCGRDWNHGQDHEGSMAQSELKDAISNASKIQNMMGQNDNLPGWVSSYITLASDYLHSIAEYMAGKSTEMQQPGPGFSTMNESIDMKKIQRADNAVDNLMNNISTNSNIPTQDKVGILRALEELHEFIGEVGYDYEMEDNVYEAKKPSAGLSKEKKSAVVKKAQAGKDIGKKGKGFEKVAQAAGGGEKGQKIAAAAMWKNIKR
jgi:hypothetical protein